jgi:hypothetical protein
MINPVQISIPQADGSDRYVVIEPIIEKTVDNSWRSTGEYKIYKDVIGDQTLLVTEPAEPGPVDDQLTDEQNPDYLGKFVFETGRVKHFEGQVLSVAEQAYLVIVIETY